eukprot:scaffold79311_cov28-Tisochrysis_lutea.AAC.4
MLCQRTPYERMVSANAEASPMGTPCSRTKRMAFSAVTAMDVRSFALLHDVIRPPARARTSASVERMSSTDLPVCERATANSASASKRPMSVSSATCALSGEPDSSDGAMGEVLGPIAVGSPAPRFHDALSK